VAAGTAARAAAFTILARVGEGTRFESALEVAVEGLQETDRRLAHEIAAGVLRQREALDRQLDRLLREDPQRLRPEVRDLLRIGAYQLIHLDRVPHYAVLSTTVELAKTVGGRRATGLVNAVLRRLATAVEQHEGSADVAACQSNRR
jgi:16S rRNA (cytosine967-C5)-methyltransferase